MFAEADPPDISVAPTVTVNAATSAGLLIEDLHAHREYREVHTNAETGKSFCCARAWCLPAIPSYSTLGDAVPGGVFLEETGTIGLAVPPSQVVGMPDRAATIDSRTSLFVEAILRDALAA